jgi:hypothetical protein
MGWGVGGQVEGDVDEQVFLAANELAPASADPHA